MRGVKRDLQAIITRLKKLTGKAEELALQLDAMQNPKAGPGRSVRASTPTAKKKTKETATETVMKVIKRQKKGIDTASLKKKTNLDTKTIRNVIFRLKKQGRVQSASRGVYTAI